MDRLLSVSQAARMVGVPRKILQQQIQEGRLATFEGHIRLSELLKAYPEVEPERSAMVEKVRRIRDSAVAGAGPRGSRDPASLSAEIQRLRVDLSLALDQVASYRQLVAETQERLVDLQERCDRRQAMLLGTLIGWFMHQVKLREGD